MATCAKCIHHSLCDYNTNISGNGKVRLVYDDGADVKCSFFLNQNDFAPKSEAEWIVQGLANPKCTECNSYNRCGDKSKFCPNCGAKMKEE